MTLTQPTKSTRIWLAKHAEIVSDFKRLARANGVKIRRHSKAYEAGIRAPNRLPSVRGVE